MILCRRRGKNLGPIAGVLTAACTVLVVGIMSCSDKSCDCPGSVAPTSGRAVVQAVLRLDPHGHFYTDAFAFSQGRVVRYPNTEGIDVDLVPFLQISAQGELLGVYFVQPGEESLHPSFHQVGHGVTLEDGQSQFEATVCIPDTAHFGQFASMAEPYDVWVVRTQEYRLAKLLVVDTYFCSQSYDSGGTTVTRYYGEVTFDWQYQPDGSSCFQ
jgi:hypothetical protein